MKIHVESAFASVAQTLETLVVQSGHAVSDAPQATLTLQHRHTPARLSITTLETNQSVEITCPIRPALLLQKLKTYHTRNSLTLNHGWQLDLLGRALVHPSVAAIPLTEKEAALLKALADAAPNALDRDTLLTQVWGIGSTIDTHTLETHIYRVRSKLSALTPAPCELITTAGAYRIHTGADGAASETAP